MGALAVQLAVDWGALAAAVSRPSQLKPGGALVLWCLGAIVFGFVLTLPAAIAWFRGEPLRETLRPVPIASAGIGKVALTGTVEPAWTMLRSPLTGRGCVYYSSEAWAGFGRSRRRIFWEGNAVPFVLSDDTGRILVLARYAGWATAKGSIGRAQGSSDDGRGLDDSTLNWVDLVPAPPVLEHFREDGYDMRFVAAHGHDSTIDVGQLVTVTGSIVPYASVIERNRRASLDGGASLGLAGDLVVAPTRYSFTGLVVMSGSPKDIRKRGSLRLALAVAGAAVVGLGFAALLIAVPIVVENSP